MTIYERQNCTNNKSRQIYIYKKKKKTVQKVYKNK